MTATTTTIDPIKTSTGDPGKAAHIVFVADGVGVTAAALVTQARIEGFEVEALCGHRWVPQQSPRDLPVCERCLEIYQQPGENRDDRDDLPSEA